MQWDVDSPQSHTITLTGANGSLMLASTPIDNSTGYWTHIMAELALSSFNTGTLRSMELHLLMAMSAGGGAYADEFVGGPTAAAGALLKAGTGVKNLVLAPPRHWIAIPKGTLVPGVLNGCSNSWAGGSLTTWLMRQISS